MPVMVAGNPEQKKYIYSKVTEADKNCLAAFCLTEPEAGSDPARMTTTFTKEGDCYYLNGKKSMITNGASAQFYSVFATSDPSLKHRGITAFYPERDYPGVVIGKNEDKMGMIGSDLTEITFDNVKLTKDNLLGQKARVGQSPWQPSTSPGRQSAPRPSASPRGLSTLPSSTHGTGSSSARSFATTKESSS